MQGGKTIKNYFSLQNIRIMFPLIFGAVQAPEATYRCLISQESLNSQHCVITYTCVSCLQASSTYIFKTSRPRGPQSRQLHKMGNPRSDGRVSPMTSCHRNFPRWGIPLSKMASCLCCLKCRWGQNSLSSGHVRLEDMPKVKLDTSFMGNYNGL